MEAIILAGGKGTRLQSVIGEAPKCMAMVAGKPFLAYLLDALEKEGVGQVILSLGYLHNVVTDWVKTYDGKLAITWVIEDEPLGTGGGLQLALSSAKTKNVIALNGDTFCLVPLAAFLKAHEENNAACTVGLKAMESFDRYGSVEFSDKHLITAFHEKRKTESGLINSGIYCIDKAEFLACNLRKKFSLEEDYLKPMAKAGLLHGQVFENYFLDIGIPEDYEKAQQDFKNGLPSI